MITGAASKNQLTQQRDINRELDREIKVSLNARKYDSIKLQDLLLKLDFVQLSIFSNWLKSEPDVSLAAQLRSYDTPGLIYNYESESYRKPNDRELHQIGNWFPSNVEQPSEKEPRPKILKGREIIAALEECVGKRSD